MNKKENGNCKSQDDGRAFHWDGENREEEAAVGGVWVDMNQLRTCHSSAQNSVAPTSPKYRVKSFPQPPGSCSHLVTAASPDSPLTSLPFVLFFQPGRSWEKPTPVCLWAFALTPSSWNFYDHHPQPLPPWLIAPLPAGLYSNASSSEGPVLTTTHFSHCLASSMLSFPYQPLFSCLYVSHSLTRTQCLCVYGLYTPLLFLERGEERQKGRKRKHQWDWLPLASPQHSPNQGPGLQPRHLSWLGIKPAVLWFSGQCSIHWDTPARAICSFYVNFSCRGEDMLNYYSLSST